MIGIWVYFVDDVSDLNRNIFGSQLLRTYDDISWTNWATESNRFVFMLLIRSRELNGQVGFVTLQVTDDTSVVTRIESIADSIGRCVVHAAIDLATSWSD